MLFRKDNPLLPVTQFPGRRSNVPDTTTSVRTLLLGCGRMGGALLEQWHQLEDFDFTAVSPSGRRQVPDNVVLTQDGMWFELPAGSEEIAITQ